MKRVARYLANSFAYYIKPYLTRVSKDKTHVPGSTPVDPEDKKISNTPSSVTVINLPPISSLHAEKSLTELKEISEEIQNFRLINNLLDWDLKTTMPEKASDERAEQISYLKQIEHEMLISKKLADLLKNLREENNFKSLNKIDRAHVRELGKEHDEEKKIPAKLLNELTETCTKAYFIWAKTKEKNDFQSFAPHLEKIFSLSRQKAEYIGYKGSPYDVLLEGSEEGLTTEELDKIFTYLKAELIPIIKRIKSSKEKIDNSFTNETAPKEKLIELTKDILLQMTLDSRRFRISETVHPFSTIMSSNDIGIAMRYKKIWDTFTVARHEFGHAEYDAEIDEALHNTILHDGTSLSIHESQSLLQELRVGAGLPFWEFYYPKLQEKFSEVFKNISLEKFYKGINRVNPTPIRNTADEVTYNLHIILRKEIEKDLIEGKIKVSDVPEIWNKKMEEYLGITPKDDSEGVLQDGHWADGEIGYFPSYTLGHLYSAQFYNQLKKEIPDIEEELKKGNEKPLKGWLKEKIHKYGRMETPKEIILRVTGEPLNPKYFIDYIKDKYSKIYNVEL